MKKIKYLILVCLSAMALCGCSDFLSAYSQDMVVASKVSHLDELLIGSVYLPSYVVARGPGNGTCGFFNILDDDVNTVGTSSLSNVGNPGYSDCVSPLFGYYAWQQDVRFNYPHTSKSDDGRTWNDLYNRINVANIILDEIEDLPRNTDEEKADFLRVKGEAHFLRASFYFILANLYGDAYTPSTCNSKLCVPLKLTAFVEFDKNADTQFSRASVGTIYKQIVDDLLQAENFLTESPQNEKHRLHRASVEAVDLLLSRVYLYMQDWEKAETKARAVMNSMNVSLSTLSDYMSGDIFLTEKNKEVIFSQGCNYLAPSVSDFSFYAGPSDYCVTRELYDLYDEADARKTLFSNPVSLIANIDSTLTGGVMVYDTTYTTKVDSVRLAKKYPRGASQVHVSDATALRTSEAYLNYAEACAMQPGKESEANRVLSILRMNRITDYVNRSYSGEELVRQIRDERRKELCFEGHRWFDLRRYAVCEPYPYSRDIIHAFNVYNDNKAFVSTVYYKLAAKDIAYTFKIPYSVLEFDKVPMPDNPRNKREPIDLKD